MSLAEKIIAEWYESKDGELLIGGIPASELVRRFGTPLFVYSGDVIRRKVQRLREALPFRVQLYYSIKANPNRDILKQMIGDGCGLEIASGGELLQALDAGCSASKIIFAGPGKSDSELEFAIEQRIGEIHAESVEEMRRISRIAARLGRTANVCIRVNPTGEAEGGAMRMGGKPAPFGIDEEQLEAALKTLLSLPNVTFTGVHLFAGTQVLHADVLISQYKKGIEIARRASEISGRPIKTLDFGGGLGVPYFAGETSLDLDKVKIGFEELIASLSSDPAFQGTTFIVEPGRFLVAEGGIYLMSVIDVKDSRGKRFYICDGGMHHHLAASGNLGQTIKRNYPIVAANHLDRESTEGADVVGPLCTPLDTVGRSAQLPNLASGDIIAILQSGAYGRTASPQQFLSHASPAEVFISQGRAEISRARGTWQDYLVAERMKALTGANG